MLNKRMNFVTDGSSKIAGASRYADEVNLSMTWDILTQQSLEPDETGETRFAGNLYGALQNCYVNKGHVDIEYISKISGIDPDEVIKELKGQIYQNPRKWGGDPHKGWEMSADYLSGNIKNKLDKAKEAEEKYPGVFEDNIKKLIEVLPAGAKADDIYVTLGSPWLPPDIIDKFIFHLFGDFRQSYYYCSLNWDEWKEYHTKHDAHSGIWFIPKKSRYDDCAGVKVHSQYGTRELGALYIIEKTLNMKSIKVMKEISDDTDSKKARSVIDEEATIEALEKQKLIIKEFQNWIWEDEKRKKRLEKIYEEKYCFYIPRKFDGSIIPFVGMTPDIKLYDYQRDAAAKIIYTPNVLLAHDVGAGKTYTMIAAGMELRRIGISKKNMYVVPNSILSQWEQAFYELYPDANILVIGPKQFTPQNRERITKDIKNNDYDGIVISQSCFEMIPLSKQYRIDQIKEQRRILNRRINSSKAPSGRLKSKLKAMDKELKQIQAEKEDNDNIVRFDKMGITRLFVDEAHQYKNVPIATQIDNVRGISSTGSKKCRNMLLKVHAVQKKGGGVIFATGTPITNSITDMYVMQLYLQSGTLAMLDIDNFDSWIGLFAEKRQEFEISVDTNQIVLNNRFSEFHNLPELSGIIAEIADFHRMEDSAGMPKVNTENVIIEKTDELAEFLMKISERAEAVRSRGVNRKKDNMLKITTDGRMAALDLRLAKEKAEFTKESKIYHCAKKAAGIYFESNSKKSTQLIFCDMGTPKKGFNIYDDLKRILIMMGLPEHEIAFIHDSSTEKKKQQLFDNVNSGKIRILIGSTDKLGHGVNVQERLIAIHHLSVPWKPSEMTQREGRIIIQGNSNPEVYIYRYITKGSFDAYSWQLLEIKQRFIEKLLSGSQDERNCEEVGDTVFSYAVVKAVALGNDLIRKRFEKINERNKYMTLQSRLNEERRLIQEELGTLESDKKIWNAKIKKCMKDINFVENNPSDNKKGKAATKKRKEIRDTIGEAVRGNVLRDKERKLLEYRGFEIILPQGMKKEEPFVWIRNNGEYVVEIGDSDTGILQRIDNKINGLPAMLDKYENNLANKKQRELDLKNELKKEENYIDEINQLTLEIKRIDEELGVEKNE